MKQGLLILCMLLSLKAVSQGSYEVHLCPFYKGTVQRTSLDALLSSYTNPAPQGLKPLLENWVRSQHLAVAILELERRTDKKLFRWRFGLNSQKGVLVDRQLADLGTRSIDKPNSKEVSCFFSDTLLVLDTLLLHVGQHKAYRFFLKINDTDVELPYDMSTTELYVNQKISSLLTPGKYIPYNVRVVFDDESKQIGNGVLYLLLPEERKQLRQVIANLKAEKNQTSDELLSQALPFLYSIWGSKNCEFRDPYDYSQAQSLEKLLTQSR